MVADHVGRTPARLRELIDIQRGSIGRQHAIGPRDASEIGEYGLLQLQVFEHGFDHDIDLIETIVGEGGADQGHDALDLLGRHLAFGGGDVVIPADGRKAAVERRLIRFLEQHRDAGIGVVHGDAAAHGARADHRRRADFGSGRVLRHAGNLGGFALGEEQADQVAGFGGEHAIGEQLDFALGAGIEAALDTGGNGVDGGVRRMRAAGGFLQAGAGGIDGGGCGGRNRRSSLPARALCGFRPPRPWRARRRWRRASRSPSTI